MSEEIEIRDHFVQIEMNERRVKTAYRFYGLGTWKRKINTQWEHVSAALVPHEAQKVAAQYCDTPDRIALQAHVQMERGYHAANPGNGDGCDVTQNAR